ncbi:MAG: DOMON-like domain-containing protein [Dechloromonas agitata]|uniref:DOMON-like domain-containing protein n=1 Tax=Dechloromonas agitata TaxID=73030 RepID=A0A930BSR5_9RHOO|nr:DOMON-like domain-containing protein [Dechloromonas agitata]
MSDLPTLHPLQPHAALPALAGLKLAAGFTWQTDGGLRLHYRLQGALDGLRLPPPARPEQTDGLWQHTCCEAFITEGAGSAYHEFNLAPSGAWAAYRFTDYRQRDTAWQPAAAPHISCRRDEDSLWLVADLPAPLLPAAPATASRLGLTAVIESRAGERSYWALQHAAPQADFHLSASFTLPLNRP